MRAPAELEAGLGDVRLSPRDLGTLELIVRRPAVGERETLDEARLDERVGLTGDGWSVRVTSSTPDGSPNPLRQVTLMNARVAQLLGGSRDRWGLAGDQLYVDLDLGDGNLPAGTRLEIGDAVLEVTPEPHRGCKKFASRFGVDALRLVNSEAGIAVNARGINTRVLRSGTVRTGDAIRVVRP